MLYPNALVTTAATVVLKTTTKITDASNMSTWFQMNCICISIPMLERKRAANKFRIGSTCTIQKEQYIVAECKFILLDNCLTNSKVSGRTIHTSRALSLPIMESHTHIFPVSTNIYSIMNGNWISFKTLNRQILTISQFRTKYKQ